MKHELPKILPTGVLPTSHFPTRMQCFLFRVWEMIEPETIAEVLGCETETVLSLAEEMGLCVPPEVDCAWKTKGYITLIRSLWHLCSYAQIAKVLSWSEETLAYILREDDFLSVKLGNSKPELPPLVYAPLTEEEKRQTAELRRIVETARKTLPAHPAKPFAFEPLFRAAAEHPAPARPAHSRYENRIVYSYCALYGDTFADRALLDASFPDALLSAYQSLGINGIWTQAVLYTLTPYPFDPTLSRGYETRLEGMRYLVRKLKSYGIRLFLYLNEPRAMPLSFFETRPDLRGQVNEASGYASLCVSAEPVRRYLYDASRFLVSAVPGLGGYLTITASENQTNCYSHCTAGHCTCERCRNRTPSEVIADTNRLLYEGAASVDPGFLLLAWNWAWDGREPDMTHRTLDRMPAGIAAMAVSEERVKKNVGGIETSVVDYSISVEGPGAYARDTWAYARSTGHRAYAKLQLGCTWEIACAPCIPAFEKVYRHLRRLSEEQCADGVMLGWTLGGFPSPTLRLAACFYDADRIPSFDDCIRELFPGEHTQALREAFHQLSEAFDAYPFHIGTAYDGPQQTGCANLLYETPTGYRATMVGFPYDDLDTWRSVYPREVFLSQLKKLSEGWHAGRLLLEAAAASSSDSVLLSLVRWTKVLDCQFASMYNQSVFVDTRGRGRIDRDAVLREKALAEEMLLYAAEDPTVGYESTNHYFFTRNALLEKLLCCERLLRLYPETEEGGAAQDGADDH